MLVTEERSFLEGAAAQGHHGDRECPRVLWLQAEGRSQTETALHPLLDIKKQPEQQMPSTIFAFSPSFIPLGVCCYLSRKISKALTLIILVRLGSALQQDTEREARACEL